MISVPPKSKTTLRKLEKSPFILNIESSTGVCSVCVSKGEEVIAFQKAEKEYQHSKALTLLIDKCLKDSNLNLTDLNAVAISSGPGSYTSLRVGASSAKGICYALDLPLISVSTLQSLALAAQKELQIQSALYCPMVDARRMEVYCCFYDSNNNPLTQPKAVILYENVFKDQFDQNNQIVFCGNGADKCRDILASEKSVFHPSKCSATFLPALSNKLYVASKFEDVAYFTPFYLKPPNITVSKNMKHLKARKIQ